MTSVFWEALHEASVVGVLLATLPLMSAALLLVYQLRHQNKLEQSRVEAGYLARALEVLHIPSEAIPAVAWEISYYVEAIGATPITEAGLSPAMRRSWDRYSAEISRFNDAVRIARSFAIERGDKELQRSLENAYSTVQELAKLLPRLMSSEINVGNVEDQTEFKAVEQATVLASTLVIRRIRRMYR